MWSVHETAGKLIKEKLRKYEGKSYHSCMGHNFLICLICKTVKYHIFHKVIQVMKQIWNWESS